MPRKSVEIKLKSIDCFIGAEAEERGIWVYIPLCWVNHFGAVIVSDVVRYNVDFAVFLDFCQVLIGPHSGHQKVCFSCWFQSCKIFDDSSVLHGSSTLLKEYSEVVRHIEELSDFLLCRVRNLSELVLSVAQFHDTLTSAFVVEHAFFCCLLEHSMWEDTRSR